GNGLLDDWCAAVWGESHDEGGQRAARGQVSPGLLKQLLADGFFSAPAPKSTGREYFNLDWLRQRAGNSLDDLPPEDVLATLTCLTARTITAAATGTDEIILCGGGIHNATLVNEIRQFADAPVVTADSRGVPADALEALAFAWLGWRALSGQKTAWAAVTGAKQDSVSAGLWGIGFLKKA
ncbi:MAG: anhydro-N-acetylmuramic acid kinase, partial [Gammaproteobacteria bacterium]